MTVPTPIETLVAAEARVALAHRRLTHTVTQLQVRLDPRERAHRAAREARIVGETATAIARDKPQVVAGIAAAGVLFLTRRSIARLLRRRRKDTSPAHAGLTPVMRTHP